MYIATWTSLKSPIMDEIRTALKKKSVKGGPSISNKDANRTWREDILGVFSEEQKQQEKARRQNKNKKFRAAKEDQDMDI
jgi:hypothetical protein